MGVTVTPQVIAESMQYRRPRDPDLAAKVQLFVKGPAVPGTFEGKTPAELLKAGEWAWHDLATAQKPPDGGLAVWTFNGKSKQWGVGKKFGLDAEGLGKLTVPIEAPTRWISTINFLASKGQMEPDTVVIHLANDSDKLLRVTSLRWWLPNERKDWQVLWPQPAKAIEAVIPPRDRGFVKIQADKPFPLTYAAVEVTTDQGPLWEHLRVKREAFDIGGGWVADNLKHEPYLKLLSRVHVNMGQIQGVPGYTDQPERYDRHPIKLCNRLWPLEEWDTDAWLPKIHAVEFLGEPQYGGGRPVPPQEVWEKLAPYQPSRLPTSVTLSEEHAWRYYAGLSDYPHYDAYRVIAPAADAWGAYDRWEGASIRWGAPLETIGDMTRSLREHSRPRPIAAWAQGAHHDWGSWRTPRRGSPTPDELRSQAWHALGHRITSLYWFNLSVKSLVKFPDLIDPISRIGREIRLLDEILLEGDAVDFQRLARDGRPDLDVTVVASPAAALVVLHDLAYRPDPQRREFVFAPREVEARVRLPAWLADAPHVFRIDADGTYDAPHERDDPRQLVLRDALRVAQLYVVARDGGLRERLEAERAAMAADEQALGFDPARNPDDLATLRRLVE